MEKSGEQSRSEEAQGAGRRLSKDRSALVGLASWLRRVLREVLALLGHHWRCVFSEDGDSPFTSRKAEWAEEEEAVLCRFKKKKKRKKRA